MEPLSDEVENSDNMKYQICNAESYKLKLAYVEDAFKYFIFHGELESYHKDTLYLQSENVQWAISNTGGEIWRDVLDKNDLLSSLDQENEEIKKAKKNSTIANAIIAGIEVLAIAATPGGGVNALVYAAESGAYIAEDREAFNVASLSVEDERNYIEDWVLSEKTLAPYDKVDFDILIDRNLNARPIQIRAILNDQTCQFEFQPEIIEERI